MKSVHKLAIKALIGVCLFILTVGFLFLTTAPAYAVDCSFETSAAYYDSVENPGEELSFQWELGSGMVKNFSWKTTENPDNWRISFEADRGQVNRDGNYYSLNLGATTEKLKTTDPEARDSLTGYLSMIRVPTDDYALAGIFEGTGTSWLIAKGKVSPRECLIRSE